MRKMIELSSINKTFKVAKRNAGMGEAVKALFKREYTTVRALRDVSFRISDGEMVGYIGPNGAGKSSTVKVMSGILTPDSGSCVINGLCPWKNRREHVRNIGVVFGQRSQLWWDVPVIDSFELIKDIYAIDGAEYRKNLDELCERLALGDIIRTPVRQLSLGQKMKCEIAASLLHNPKILFLDEPTIGLDAVSKLAVRDFLKKLNREKNTTVILTTHDMQDIEALAQRILLIGKGSILLDGTLESLKQRNSAVKKIKVTYAAGSFALPDGISVASGNPVTEGGGQIVFCADTEKISVSSAIEILSKNADITDISVESETAEELIVSLYKEFSI